MIGQLALLKANSDLGYFLTQFTFLVERRAKSYVAVLKDSKGTLNFAIARDIFD